MSENKSIFEFSMTQEHASNITNFNYSQDISTISLENGPVDLFYSLTESIVYFEDSSTGNGYFIITTEGYRDFGYYNVSSLDPSILLYDADGSFVNNLTFCENIFGITDDSGFADGEGIKSMTITPDYNYVMWMPSDTLVQDDDCLADGCVSVLFFVFSLLFSFGFCVFSCICSYSTMTNSLENVSCGAGCL